MKLKLLDSLEEGELFFAYADTSDGKDLRSYFRGPRIGSLEIINCECSSGDPYETKDFHIMQRVWA